jgi:prefoldin subunit 5
MNDCSDEAAEVYKNRIEILKWVIENHKAAISRMGKAIEAGDQEQIAHVWQMMKKYTEPLPVDD